MKASWGSGMKYALLNCDEAETGKDGEAAIVNVGSVAMRLAMHELLLNMGISENDIIQVNLSELNSYDGEYVIMPINMHWMQDAGNRRLLSMSHKIKPVFLSISLNDTTLDSEQISFLRRYEPIGCRDDRTMCLMLENGIDAYEFGCIAGTFNAGGGKTGKQNGYCFFGCAVWSLEICSGVDEEAYPLFAA